MPVQDLLRKQRWTLAAALAVVVLAWLVYAGTGDPHLRHTSALNAVFDARWMVSGARLLAVVATVYLLASVGVRVRRGQWVRSAGSVVTDTSAAQALADDREDLQHQLVEAKATIDDLTERLGRSLAAREESLATMGTSRGSGPGTRATRGEGADGDG